MKIDNKLLMIIPVFCDQVPSNTEQGKVYVSMKFATAIHLCACGCQNEIVTPFSPKDWNLLFDGKTISLNPSIGNWQLKCHSHYWIKKNQIVWADNAGINLPKPFNLFQTIKDLLHKHII